MMKAIYLLLSLFLLIFFFLFYFLFKTTGMAILGIKEINKEFLIFPTFNWRKG
jgi:hypothetical protein